MSWPVTVYYCTACDFEQWDAGTWGTREYVLNSGVRIPVRSHIGWCASCSSIAAIEDLSMGIRMQDYREAQRGLSKFSRGIFGFFKYDKSTIRILEDDSADAIDALEMLISRKNPEHCLRCLSTQVHEFKHRKLDNDEVPDSPCIFNASNHLTSESESALKLKEKDNRPHWQHPGCEGRIQTKPADGGLRIGLRPSIHRYTPEGLLIVKEFVGGYCSPNRQYYDTLSESNRQNRT